jgi:hypothetical protein
MTITCNIDIVSYLDIVNGILVLSGTHSMPYEDGNTYAP